MAATGTVHVERIARPSYGARRRDAFAVEAVERRDLERLRDLDRKAARAAKRVARVMPLATERLGDAAPFGPAERCSCGGAASYACVLFCGAVDGQVL